LSSVPYASPLEFHFCQLILGGLSAECKYLFLFDKGLFFVVGVYREGYYESSEDIGAIKTGLRCRSSYNAPAPEYCL
jgi:hypothetical protein